MDPYRTLGVSRDCTREELKAAFRARVPPTHPDRGGDDADFIQLRRSYERILAVLDRRERREAARDRSRTLKNGDSNSADLAYTASDVGQAMQVASPRDEPVKKPSDSPAARTSYFTWLRRVSADAASRNPRRRWKWVRRVGVSFLLYMVASALITVFFSAATFIYESSQEPPRYEEQPGTEDSSRKPERKPTTVESLAIATGLISPYLVIFILVCKYDDVWRSQVEVLPFFLEREAARHVTRHSLRDPRDQPRGTRGVLYRALRLDDPEMGRADGLLLDLHRPSRKTWH